LHFPADQSLRARGSAKWPIPLVSACLSKTFLSDNWDHDRAAKRGGNYEFVLFDQQTAEAIYDAASAGRSTPESLFDVRWAKTLTSDNTGVKSRATFTYTVCAAGTTNCSNVVVVQYGG